MVYRIIIQKIKERRHYYWLKKMTKEAEDSLRKPGQLLDKNQKSLRLPLGTLGEKRF